MIPEDQTPLRDPLEYRIHQSIVTALDNLLLPPAFYTTFPAGHLRLTGEQAAKLERMRVKRGIPDILYWYDSMSFGQEIKRFGGQLSKSYWSQVRCGRGWRTKYFMGQEEAFALLRAAGMKISIVHSVQEALEDLVRWGLPIRKMAA